ncbi:MAG: HAD hydrolase-like protein, partial [Candidatus Gastranaerophilales bacterium]|nr:HAD hydrolase-like protein [Candidatus Gastranaerophilales bacterium]
MINRFDNFIFDLDGTLVNSSKEVLLCFDKAFQKANYPIDYARLNTNVIGPPLYDIVKLIAPELKDDVKINEIIKYYEELYDYDDNDISSTYDGVIDLLNSLKYEGKKLYIATYKPITPTMRILNKFKLNMFDDIYT